MRRASLIFGSVVAGCLGCDHASKTVAQDLLGAGDGVFLAGGSVHLALASNPGGFLDLGSGLPDPVRQMVFVGLVPVLVVVLCALFLRSQTVSVPLVVGLGLLAGGGLSNWLDRLLNGGAVTDFVSVGMGPLRSGVFNLADLAVIAGLLLLLALGRDRAPRASESPRYRRFW